MKVLRALAEQVGAKAVSKEQGLTIVPLRGGGNKGLAAAFALLNKQLLDSAVRVWLVLDRDYMSDAEADELLKTVQVEGIDVHIWKRHELESYLISTSAISRVSGFSESDVDTMLDIAVSELRSGVHAQRLAEAIKRGHAARVQDVTTISQFNPAFDAEWSNRENRLRMSPAKELLTSLRRQIEEKIQADTSTFTNMRLAKALRTHEIPTEMRDLLLAVEADLLAVRPTT